MDSIEYGNVPQHRTRIFIVAFKDEYACEKFSFPEKIELTVKLNDILKRAVKHDSCYYLNRTNRSGILSAGPIGRLNQDGNYLIDARYNRNSLIGRIEKNKGL